MPKNILLYISFTLTTAIQGWALQDLEFVKKCIIENHPGIYNSEDPFFRNNIEMLYSQSVEALTHAHSENQCKKIVGDFANSFGDLHLSITFPTFVVHPSLIYPFKKEPFSTNPVNRNLSWIRIPTFESSEATIAALEKTVTQVSTLRMAPYIAFDLRGNTGGSSFWGEQLVYALLGKDYVDYKRTTLKRCEYVEWRASRDNILYWKNDVLPFMDANFPSDSKEALWAHATLEGLQNAYTEQKPYYYECTLNHTEVLAPVEPIYKGTILVIIDEYCSSACLDFIDELKEIAPKIFLIGHTTARDTVYMEVRSVPLPSKKGILTFPIKVARNRVRPHGEPHKPDYKFQGDMHNTEAVQQYVSSLINKCLKDPESLH